MGNAVVPADMDAERCQNLSDGFAVCSDCVWLPAVADGDYLTAIDGKTEMIAIFLCGIRI